MDWLPVDWNLLKNPINWVVVTLMILIAGFALRLIVPANTTQE